MKSLVDETEEKGVGERKMPLGLAGNNENAIHQTVLEKSLDFGLEQETEKTACWDFKF